jgi:hypothetical protein
MIRLIDGTYESGSHKVVWNSRNAASGIYFYEMRSGDFQARRKMLHIK